MAETVDYFVEFSIRELEVLEGLKLFERSEIKEILKRRKRFEYALRRQKVSKECFTNYIEYEINVYKLIQKRRARFNVFERKDEVEYAITDRVMRLYKTAQTRFSSDMKLWFDNIKACKIMRAKSSVDHVYARLLQLHCKDPEVWIAAADYQLVDCKAPDMARKLLLRGLQFDPDSRRLYVKFFEMELKHRQIELKKHRDNPEALADVLRDAEVAKVVYKNATTKIEDYEMATALFEVACRYEDTIHLQKLIIHDLKSRFPLKEELWNMLAERELRNKENGKTNLEEAIKIFERAVSKLNTERMWALYIAFAIHVLDDTRSDTLAAKRFQFALELFERVPSEFLTEDIVCEHGKLLVVCEDFTRAGQLIADAIKRWPHSSTIWVLRLQIIAKDGQVGDEEVFQVFEEALAAVRYENSLDLWTFATEHWKNDVDRLQAIYERAITMPSVVSVPFKGAYLRFAYIKDGFNAAIQLYQRLIKQRPLHPSVYRFMIECVKEQKKVDPAIIRKIYMDAVSEHGKTDVDLWLEYLAFEQSSLGNIADSGLVYQKAVKILNSDLLNQFIARHSIGA